MSNGSGASGTNTDLVLSDGSTATIGGDIDGAESATYTPKANDVGGNLTATVMLHRRGRFRPDWHWYLTGRPTTVVVGPGGQSPQSSTRSRRAGRCQRTTQQE